MRFTILLLLSCLVAGFSTTVLPAETSPSANDARTNKTLIVAVKPAPPFVIKQADGGYEGISIQLWESIARELAINYRYQEVGLRELLDGVARARYDVGVGAITVTAQREKYLDFSQPFYNSGLGIAVRSNNQPGWLSVATQFFSLDFLQAAAALAGILLLSGALVWFFERQHNREEFDTKAARGIGAGFWWAAVTMTTVGYGDKSPRSLGGRIVGLVWMFTSVIIISSFTASIAASLTVNQLSNIVGGPEDLDNVRVGSITKSFSGEWLQQNQIGFQNQENLSSALNALAAGKLGAVVYDAPLLRYYTRDHHSLAVLPNTFMSLDYALVYPEGYALSEGINRQLLQMTAKPSWQETVDRYLGK